MDAGVPPGLGANRLIRKERSTIVGGNDKGIEIRVARAGDVDGLLTIERECFNVYYYAFYMLDRRDFEYCLDDPDSLFLVALLDGRLAGYVLGPVEGWRVPPAAHIDSIAVLPEAQHVGIGDRLLRAFVQGVGRHGCRAVTLEVSPANEIGMAFFAKQGFKKVRRLRNYYGKDLHGLRMKLSWGSMPPNE